MLDCERCTLTHSSGAAVVVALPLPLVSGLGLVVPIATCASRVAAVAVAVAVDVAVAVLVGVLVAVLVPAGDGAGEVRSGPLLTLAEGDDTVGGSVTLAEWVADGLVAGGLVAGGLVAGALVEGDGDGDGGRDREGDGEGVGVGVPEDGSAWHTVSVFGAGALGAACAVPSTPRVRKLPLSKMTAATLAYAKRIKDRLSTLLVRVTVCSSWFVGDSGTDGYAGTHFR